uniref:Uncharacterized protein n=1 Tax=Physcomitrium patens TaxID=3218 RepID=A0A2K1INU9_PHYPA|nr:hypothetical protein PHYPA_027275 [Physcomitrium patens]
MVNNAILYLHDNNCHCFVLVAFLYNLYIQGFKVNGNCFTFLSWAGLEQLLEALVLHQRPYPYLPYLEIRNAFQLRRLWHSEAVFLTDVVVVFCL